MSSPSIVLSRAPVATGRPGLLPPVLVALLCIAYAAGSAAGWGTAFLAAVMGDFGLSAASLCAGASCLWYAHRSPGCSRPAWVLFATSSFMVATGNAVWGWYEVVLDRPVPSVSLADCFFLLFAPPAIVGLLVLAKRPYTRLGWVCLGLDSWLISGSLITLTWSLALAHTADSSSGDSLRTAITLAYPLLDIVMVSMVLALRFRRSSANRAAVNTALAALAVTVLCDALFTTPVLRDSYRSGQLLDAGWFSGSMMLAYAPWVSAREDAARATRRMRAAVVTQPVRRVAGALTALTPYVAAAVCSLGIIYSALHGRRVDRVVLLTCCLVVLALAIRQGIMLLDNISLTQELAQKENHFRSLVQGSSDVIMIATPTGVLRYVSPASQGVYGRSPQDLVGTEFARLVHPADLGPLLRELRRFLTAPPSEEAATRIECRIRSGNGTWLHVESTVNRHQDGLIFNCRDVTERVRLQAQLQHSASHDALTDLPNRALFTERVRQALGGRRTGDGVAAVLFIDLDGFKAVNDTVGHQAGDELLVHAARRLQEAVRAADTVARFGGDEFAALVCGGSEDRYLREFQIREVADRIRLSLSEPYRVAGTTVRVAASIGVAFAEPGITCTELMRNADLAMYRAKSAGKGRVEMYVPQMQADVVRRTELAGRLRAALHEGEFALLHQPVVDLVTGRISIVEAQARWRSAQGILLTPAEFLRMAEDSGRTAELSRWLVGEAVEQAADRRRAGYRTPVAVRISAKRLLDRGVPDDGIEAVVRRLGLAPDGLVLEVSESDPRDSMEELQRRLEGLKRMGVRIALDCFGAGSGSMTALRRLPVDIVKIDRSFVEGVLECDRLYKLTAGMLRLATELGLTTIADGVDTPEQAQALRAMGCTYAQGLVFSGPLEHKQLEHALAAGAYPVPHASPPAVVPAGALPAHHLPGSHDETSVPPA
ncbi:phosphodiesterase [Wenjunlia vitaminophila]|uniref:Phosphodiesterase n=1 Tax=Wenjunlia vitaminophila TaxID=76728 RepID=A0A0T6LTB1_WENVI|nr:EAL domain-containing protein [Wenjunlia vitaminophila]KRV49374.1 phosphodiesterase [Wenjunlia vitaminophila]